jgi:hypothetical protein
LASWATMSFWISQLHISNQRVDRVLRNAEIQSCPKQDSNPQTLTSDTTSVWYIQAPDLKSRKYSDSVSQFSNLSRLWWTRRGVGSPDAWSSSTHATPPPLGLKLKQLSVQDRVLAGNAAHGNWIIQMGYRKRRNTVGRVGREIRKANERQHTLGSPRVWVIGLL